MSYNYMTQEGYDRILAEINELETVQRPEVIRQIADARDKGDLSENAEYDAAKETQGHLESKIAKLKATLAQARIIDQSRIGTDTVQILNTITILNRTTKTKMVYTLVPEMEANIKEGKISVATPIAKGLLGKRVGDVAEVQVPNGKLQLEILEIN